MECRLEGAPGPNPAGVRRPSPRAVAVNPGGSGSPTPGLGAGEPWDRIHLQSTSGLDALSTVQIGTYGLCPRDCPTKEMASVTAPTDWPLSLRWDRVLRPPQNPTRGYMPSVPWFEPAFPGLRADTDKRSKEARTRLGSAFLLARLGERSAPNPRSTCQSEAIAGVRK
jgi:hypothetical protein